MLIVTSLHNSSVSDIHEIQVNIRSIDEAIVIGAALSLSSSAFVLQVFIKN